jgi:hypothetical protein
MNTSPPWSRRLSTQPQTVTVWLTSSARNWPHVCVRNKAAPFVIEFLVEPAQSPLENRQSLDRQFEGRR